MLPKLFDLLNNEAFSRKKDIKMAQFRTMLYELSRSSRELTFLSRIVSPSRFHKESISISQW